ncbi:MAG: hypothetical protein WAL98_11780 [Desulfatiglandaceae bacterium]|jgi:hypothetical protein
MIPNEIVSFTGAQGENLKLFFGHFLIVHLASNSGMDGYLGYTPPEALALSNSYFFPQIGVHPLRGV